MFQYYGQHSIQVLNITFSLSFSICTCRACEEYILYCAVNRIMCDVHRTDVRMMYNIECRHFFVQCSNDTLA